MFRQDVKCTLLLENKNDPTNPKLEMQYEDGSPVSNNELPEVDIGRDRWPYKIPAQYNPLTWKFINTSPDILAYHQRVAINVAFRTIGFLIPRRYRYIHDQTQNTFFTQRFTHDLSVFNDRTTVLAHAYLYRPGSSMNGIIEWNDNYFFTPYGDPLPAYLVDPANYTEGEKWTNGDLKTLATQPFLEINMHEIKHAHGYWHDENSPESLMYPRVKPGYIRVTRNGVPEHMINSGAFLWTADDIQRWHNGYGARRFQWLNRFRMRRLQGRFDKRYPYRLAA